MNIDAGWTIRVCPAFSYGVRQHFFIFNMLKSISCMAAYAAAPHSKHHHNTIERTNIMKLKFMLMAALAACSASSFAQKALYIPHEWQMERSDTLLYKESDPDNKYTWSKSRSKESENFIVYWDKYYKNTIPTNANSTYSVDIDDLLKKAESFYALNIGELGFCNESKSNVSKYKMMILINHTTDWVCYGGGYDDTIGALWLSPSTCKPIGHSVAHEVGHSFQYQCYADLKGYAGFRTAIGNGSAFWEQTAQWQAAQAYPELKWDQSWNLYPLYANCAMTNEWMRYQSYWWHYFLAEKYGIDFIGKLWRHDTGKGQDPNEVLMHLLSIDAKGLYKLYFEYALKMTTIDLDVARNEAAPYIGTYPFRYHSVGDNKYQVSYYSCPQSTGFNVIPLNIPNAGEEIVTTFTSLKSNANLAEGDRATYLKDGKETDMPNKTKYNSNPSYNAQRGFRLGYVALMKDGTRQYIYEDSLYCAQGGLGNKTVDVKATVPEGVERLWLVVVPAPRTYVQHKWDEDLSNDDQWPYTVEFRNTNIYGAPTISDDLPVSDVTISYDIKLPYSSTDYSFVPVKVAGEAAAALGTALQMPASELDNHMTGWTSAAPEEGQAKFYAVNRLSGGCVNKGSTANGYGHWFNASGTCTDYGNGSLYSEFTPSTLTFNVGQKPKALTQGKKYTISQAVKYRKDSNTAVARFIFNVTCVSSATQSGYSISSIKQSDIVTGIDTAPAAAASSAFEVTNIAGIRSQRLSHGINIVRKPGGEIIKVLDK